MGGGIKDNGGEYTHPPQTYHDAHMSFQSHQLTATNGGHTWQQNVTGLKPAMQHAILNAIPDPQQREQLFQRLQELYQLQQLTQNPYPQQLQPYNEHLQQHALQQQQQVPETMTNEISRPSVANSAPAPLNEQAITALGNFAHELCQKIMLKNEKSYAISPVSIIAVVGMLLSLLPNESDKLEILKNIGLTNMTVEQAHSALSGLLQSLELPESPEFGTISNAQAIAHKPHLSYSKEQKDVLLNTYKSEVICAEDLKTQVNDWVKQKTRGMIPSILPDNKDDKVLVNALYLALNWTLPFQKPEKGWPQEQFTFSDGTTMMVPMMTQWKSQFSTFSSDQFDMVKLNYKGPNGRDLAQLIFLPKKGVHVNAVDSLLNYGVIKHCLANVTKETFSRLSIPKIKTSYSEEVSKILKTMGLDFGIDIIHKTMVINDEKGSKAAAVTVGRVRECASLNAPPPKVFVADRPYVYLIMDGDVILFRGSIRDIESFNQE